MLAEAVIEGSNVKWTKNNTEHWLRLGMFGINRFEWLPWWRNDGYRGFFHFLFFHLNWYPSQKCQSEVIQ